MKNKTDFFIGLALLAFCCVMGYQIHLIPEPAALDFFSAGSFPTGVTIALALLSLVLVARAVLGKDESAACWPERKLAVKIGMMGNTPTTPSGPKARASSSPRWFSSPGRRC